MDKTLNDGHEEEKKGKKGGMDRTLNDGQEEEKKGKNGEEWRPTVSFHKVLQEECKKGELDAYEKLFL